MQRDDKYMARGVGYSWTELRPTPGQHLFGGGGQQDGVVATITDRHAENVQEEEARTLDKNGTSGNLDVATDPQYEDAANANKEFNFSQFKNDRDHMTQIDLSTSSDGVAAGDILIVNNRIAGIGKAGTVRIPEDAKIFDLSGKVVIPGIVDVHAHWEVRHSVLDTEDYTFLGNLAYGVTTGRDPQTSTNDTFAYQDLVDTGQMTGPRIFTTGP